MLVSSEMGLVRDNASQLRVIESFGEGVSEKSHRPVGLKQPQHQLNQPGTQGVWLLGLLHAAQRG